MYTLFIFFFISEFELGVGRDSLFKSKISISVVFDQFFIIVHLQSFNWYETSFYFCFQLQFDGFLCTFATPKTSNRLIINLCLSDGMFFVFLFFWNDRDRIDFTDGACMGLLIALFP